MILHKDKKYIFQRYPPTNLSSLQAWNAADEYILKYAESLNLRDSSLIIFNDRFGFLTSLLYEFSPNVVINFVSQQKAIRQNLVANDLAEEKIKFVEPLAEASEKFDVAFVKVPKSMELFRLQLFHISKILDKSGIVICGFMTKHFTKQILSIAENFFETVEQSQAWKKSRVLILKNLKDFQSHKIINSIAFEDQIFKQYFGVFSSKQIDSASAFLIKNWKIENNIERVLDLASGNGFLGKMIRLQNPACEIHLLDDDWLAVESSKMNFSPDDDKIFFHFNDSLENFDADFFDLIVCNPPFHFEHENNIEVAIRLFHEAERVLKKTGSFQIVANRHLNYKTHLNRIFEKVETLKTNQKFVIYECRSANS